MYAHFICNLHISQPLINYYWTFGFLSITYIFCQFCLLGEAVFALPLTALPLIKNQIDMSILLEILSTLTLSEMVLSRKPYISRYQSKARNSAKIDFCFILCEADLQT